MIERFDSLRKQWSPRHSESRHFLPASPTWPTVRTSSRWGPWSHARTSACCCRPMPGRPRLTHDLRLIGRLGRGVEPPTDVILMTSADDRTLSALYRGADASSAPRSTRASASADRGDERRPAHPVLGHPAYRGQGGWRRFLRGDFDELVDLLNDLGHRHGGRAGETSALGRAVHLGGLRRVHAERLHEGRGGVTRRGAGSAPSPTGERS